MKTDPLNPTFPITQQDMVDRWNHIIKHGSEEDKALAQYHLSRV